MTAIQPVVDGDLDELVPMMSAYCGFYETSPPPEQLAALARALLADPDNEGVQLLARDESGAAVGFATMYWSWDTTVAIRIAIMHDLFVDPSARGGGVGRALIEGCAFEARRRGLGRLVWSTAPDNATAQRVYDATAAERSTWVEYSLAL